MNVWQDILNDYDRRHSCSEQDEIAWFRDQPSLRQAIEVAAHATDQRGRLYSHQYRIRRISIAQAGAALVAAEQQIARVGSFDELLTVITGQLREVSGTGELHCYDTAFRIGAHLGLLPTRVYLHAGTRVGARALDLAYEKDSLKMSEIPAELWQRAPHEVEDILCIYADAFRGGAISADGCLPLRCGSSRVRC